MASPSPEPTLPLIPGTGLLPGPATTFPIGKLPVLSPLNTPSFRSKANSA